MATFRFFRTLGLAAGLAMGLVGGSGRLMVPASAAESKPAATAFQDEPAAHALYNQMIEAMRKADSLSYVSRYRLEAKGRVAWRLHLSGVAEEAELLPRGNGIDSLAETLLIRQTRAESSSATATRSGSTGPRTPAMSGSDGPNPRTIRRRA